MFEKEAEEWRNSLNYEIDNDTFNNIVIPCIEFGYNKANEWHDLRKNPKDLPTKKLEGKQLLLRVCNYTEDYILAYYMLDKYYSPHGKRFYSDTDCDYPINIKNIIAWKEIVLPKGSE